MLFSEVKKIMPDFFEALDYCAFDVAAASTLTKNAAKPLREIIDEILEEAGLDAMVAVQSKSISKQHD